MQSILERLSVIGFDATEDQVKTYLSQKGLKEESVSDDDLFDMVQSLETPKATPVAAIAPSKKSASKSSAIAPVTQTAPIAQPSSLKTKAAGVVEEALIEQQTEAAKLAADSAASNADFMKKVRDRAAELDSAAEEADVDEAAKLVRQARVTARTQTMDFLQQMVGQTTGKSIENIRESVEVLEAELV